MEDAARAEASTQHGLPPAAHARRAHKVGSAAEPGPHVSQQIALTTLREEEADTALDLLRIGRAIGIAALVPLPFVGGSVGLRIALVVAVAVAITVGAVIEQRVRRRRYASERTVVVLAVSAGPAVYIAVLYFGLLSAVQLFPALAVYFFGRRAQRSSALSIFIANFTVEATLAALVLGGAIDDPGMVRPDLPVATAIAGHALMQFAFFGAYYLGRLSYRASLDAISKMQHALQLAAQREALLQEARADLDRALAIDAAGPYTGHVFGSYRIGNVIGRGGMGEVYEAEHVTTGEAAAVKLLGRRDLSNVDSVERFVRELRAIRGLGSRHVVRVLETSAEGDPIPYLAMERLRGVDLAHHMRADRLPPSQLLEMLDQIGEAVEEAWTKGVVHRDLKPHNLFLAESTPEPVWKVLDFGVAALDQHSGTLTQGQIVGTPVYMAPEQARGERVDHRADVYALAAVGYRWLTGRPLWATQDMHHALYQTVNVMPERPGSHVELHEDVDDVFAIALCKQPADRFASCRELRDALASALAGELEPALRERAAALLSRQPWGSAARLATAPL